MRSARDAVGGTVAVQVIQRQCQREQPLRDGKGPGMMKLKLCNELMKSDMM